MRPGGAGSVHLTYCTNIHPGETWEEIRRNLADHVLRVKALVSPRAPFGVGLRLSAEAARTLAETNALDDLSAFLSDHDLYVFTINGFPYGRFHGARVKEDVYRPDWLQDERLAYSDVLAHVLAALLPDGLSGSVSTVPGCYRPRAATPEALAAVADRLILHAATLVRLDREHGKCVTLALEPEPFCVLETVAETVRFFEDHVFTRGASARLAASTGLGPAESEAALHRHLGVCLDACHAAVEFERPAEAVAALRRAGIKIAKVQVSAGLVVEPPSDAQREALRSFAEDVYLHQVVARRGEALLRYPDLEEALQDPAAARADEWRIHFHVPLFREELGPFRNTQGFLRELLSLQAKDPVSTHLEVETYTWDVLPDHLKTGDIVEYVTRELDWVKGQLV